MVRRSVCRSTCVSRKKIMRADNKLLQMSSNVSLQRYSASFGEKNKQQSNRNGRYDWIFKLKVKVRILVTI